MKVAGWKKALCAVAGSMDAGTGLLLIAAPQLTVLLMGLDSEATPVAHMRFIGAFVFAIGSLYFVALRYAGAGRVSEWRALWIATAWARLCVGSVVAWLIARGDLEVAWISVPLSDLTLGALQFSTAGKPEGVDVGR